MSLTKMYALTCDNCGRLQQDGRQVYSTSTEARRKARAAGWERLQHPENVRQGLTSADNVSHRRDFCRMCAPIVREALAEIGKDQERAARAKAYADRVGR
ncbi:MAG TPA: hypothetical protein VGH72_33830 [Pseudonocardia sp.]